jgi:dienelactone hydrolase
MSQQAIRRIHFACLALAAVGLAATAAAQEPAQDEVVFVTRKLFPFDASLETTVYRPAGLPPWPMAVINHGQRSFGTDHRDQPRNRPLETARFFLERGYLVVAPMRQGFSRSGGVYSFRCDHEQYALRYAGDIGAAIDHFIDAGLARADQVLVTGQSNGGFVLLGYGASASGQARRARATINFSGGFNWNRPECDWRAGMTGAAASLGARTQIPALWLYAADDSIFPPAVSQPFFEAYHAVQPQSAFKLYPAGGHGMSLTASGRSMWGPDVEAFLREQGLPWKPLSP